MEKIQYLFYFSSEDLCLLETKRTDLPSHASMSDIYKWLIYSKSRGEFIALSFRNMIKEANFESRTFAEAELKFDSTKAELRYQGKIFQLVKENPDQIPLNMQEATMNYLFGLVQHY